MARKSWELTKSARIRHPAQLGSYPCLGSPDTPKSTIGRSETKMVRRLSFKNCNSSATFCKIMIRCNLHVMHHNIQLLNLHVLCAGHTFWSYIIPAVYVLRKFNTQRGQRPFWSPFLPLPFPPPLPGVGSYFQAPPRYRNVSQILVGHPNWRVCRAMCIDCS